MTSQHEHLTVDGGVRVVFDGKPTVRAGECAQFTITIEADFALPCGAEVGFARRWPSDWGLPQWNNPEALDHVRFWTTNAGPIRTWNSRLHAWHPFDHALFVALPAGLTLGERLTAQFGGQGDHAPGYTVQTFIEEASPLTIRMRTGTDVPWQEIARPVVQIVGSTPHRLVLTAPSRVQAGVPFLLHLRVEDRWGNPAALDTPVKFEAPLTGEVTLPPEGWMRVPMMLNEVGVHRLCAESTHAKQLKATSNPVEVTSGPVDKLLCWGDIHAQSVIGCGARSIDAYFRHARDFAATDFGSHQANCFLVSNPEWQETMEATQRAQVDGRFVTLLGVEWSGASSSGGDHNLYFPGDGADLHRCSHEFITDRSDIDTDLPHVNDLHAHYRGSNTLIALHVGGRTADLRWHEPTLDRLLEVHSTHATSEWFLFDALNRGYQMGVIAGSDSVDGRPGGSHPGHMGVRNVGGGLTAVTMPELSRTALWNALSARHCYGTTGPRILLRLQAGQAQMGDELRVSQVPPFQVSIEGTAPIETVDFFRGITRLERVDHMSHSGKLSNWIRVGWSGASAPGNWQRARMQWDGELQVTGARIVAAEPWAFDTPDEGIQAVTSDRVRWRSITAGDWDGCLLEIDDPASATLLFMSQPMTVQTKLDAVGPAPLVFKAERPERKLELRRLPVTMPALGWHGTFEDASPIVGTHAYWVRVRQADGAYAWSTPIFVTLEPGS